MTVAELIEKLKTMPQEAMVVADAYEEGYDAIKKLKQIKVAEMAMKDWYYGFYDDSKEPDAIEVVYLDVERGAGK